MAARRKSQNVYWQMSQIRSVRISCQVRIRNTQTKITWLKKCRKIKVFFRWNRQFLDYNQLLGLAFRWSKYDCLLTQIGRWACLDFVFRRMDFVGLLMSNSGLLRIKNRRKTPYENQKTASSYLNYILNGLMTDFFLGGVTIIKHKIYT